MLVPHLISLLSQGLKPGGNLVRHTWRADELKQGRDQHSKLMSITCTVIEKILHRLFSCKLAEVIGEHRGELQFYCDLSRNNRTTIITRNERFRGTQERLLLGF